MNSAVYRPGLHCGAEDGAGEGIRHADALLLGILLHDPPTTTRGPGGTRLPTVPQPPITRPWLR
ncbi:MULTISPECIES: hypothetical protein [Actinoalloteichus]|uniref:hypothetical protein n=1 Tax=Actinoalloteichus TaxID=65496 RepID=UPI0018DD76BA|nr:MULTISPECIES: hypothetical protein [Actinoalloteichus]